jgi:TolB protein
MVAAAGLVGCSTSADVTTEAAATRIVAPDQPVSLPTRGDELPAGRIPWDQVGPGWILATWSPVPGRHPGEKVPEGEPLVAPATLFLIDPAGVRYPITTLPVMGADTVSGDPGHSAGLADWSGDGTHALLEHQDNCPMSHDTTGWHCIDPDAAKQHTTFTDVDLTTGATRTFTVNGFIDGSYTRPTGQAVLLSPRYPDPTRLRRVDLNGAEQLTDPTDLGAAGTFTGGFLATSDGTQLVFGGDKGLVMVGNDGVVGRQLPLPDSITDCRPVRWWTATTILADCDDVASSGGQLWTVPIDGGAPAALTAPNTGQQDSGFGPDLHDAAAWQLPSGTFLQSLGACGTVFVSRLTPDMHTTRVRIPGVDSSSVQIQGASGDKLVLEAQAGCGPGTSLLAYDPAANSSTVLLGPKVNGGGVQAAIIYPNQ